MEEQPKPATHTEPTESRHQITKMEFKYNDGRNRMNVKMVQIGAKYIVTYDSEKELSKELEFDSYDKAYSTANAWLNFYLGQALAIQSKLNGGL